MKTIWKYDPVIAGHLDGNTGRFALRLPVGAEFLHAAAQIPDAMYPVLWFEVETEEERTRRSFALVPTGGEIPEAEPADSGMPPVLWDYRGTAVCCHGRLVWHLYAEPDDRIPF